MFMHLLLCALVLVGARADRKRPTGSVEFEQLKADMEPFSEAIVLNDADFTKYQGYKMLNMTMQDCQNTRKTIVYSHFSLGSKPDYKLNIYRYASDKVRPEDFSANNGRPFATYDKLDDHECALHMRAGWWYNFCSNTLPTGKYYKPCGSYTPPG
ncbi:hypothetical protein DPMN_075027 [Dreissena polymorpha]|uniref:Fibrinogen C-terminal domain-containing protein n=1 Tax=Dreissena polymorpha TaxID=45954 RepID=A0A9D3YIT1_DREPO|nr:hypothetical protein DPMN_075027 [Dreissena polymorpha]